MVDEPIARRDPPAIESLDAVNESQGAEAQRRIEQLVARFRPDPRVTEGTGFGKSRGLRVGGKIFAIFGDRELTVKLPEGRVDELIGRGIGIRFDAGRGRSMREWITVPGTHAEQWEVLTEESFDFVRASR
jgi:hypothetical protein